MKSLYLFCLCLLFIQSSCSNKDFENQSSYIAPATKNIDGFWVGELYLKPNKALPFNFKINGDSVFFYNANETIRTKIITDTSQVYTIKMPVFNSAFNFKVIHDTIKGNWINYFKGDNYSISFSAFKTSNAVNRFFKTPSEKAQEMLKGNWEVAFAPNSQKEFKAIGIFNKKESVLSGTFLTETGDYRYLQGACTKDSLFLSCFDGSHAFLFEASLTDSSLDGVFYSGTHYQEKWVASKNNNFKLADPYSITSHDESQPVHFSFPDTDSVLFNFPDSSLLNKVVILQIIGSWCPNCLDETQFFTSLYNNYHHKGLEIVALAYEKQDTFNKKANRVMKLKNHFNAGYPFLIAGNSSKKEVEKTLPFLTNVASFPTTIYIDKYGKIRRIYSGFYGPGTGRYHEIFSKETHLFVESLLEEKIID